jgi:hypothetical protein
VARGHRPTRESIAFDTVSAPTHSNRIDQRKGRTAQRVDLFGARPAAISPPLPRPLNATKLEAAPQVHVIDFAQDYTRADGPLKSDINSETCTSTSLTERSSRRVLAS